MSSAPTALQTGFCAGSPGSRPRGDLRRRRTPRRRGGTAAGRIREPSIPGPHSWLPRSSSPAQGRAGAVEVNGRRAAVESGGGGGWRRRRRRAVLSESAAAAAVRRCAGGDCPIARRRQTENGSRARHAGSTVGSLPETPPWVGRPRDAADCSATASGRRSNPGRPGEMCEPGVYAYTLGEMSVPGVYTYNEHPLSDVRTRRTFALVRCPYPTFTPDISPPSVRCLYIRSTPSP